MSDLKFKVDKTPLCFTIIQEPFYEKFFKLKTFEVNPCVYKANEERFTNALKHFNPADTDGFYFSSVPINDNLPKIENHDGYIRYLTKIHEQAYMDVSGSFEEYWSRFSSKSRSTLKRKMRKIEKMSGGEIDWRIYQTPEELTEFFKLAKDISKQTYQETWLNLGLPDDPEYFADMLKAAEQGNVRGYLLFVDGEAVSYLYCPINNRAAEFAYLGYLPKLSNLSVGTVLFIVALENIFEDKDIDYFDFQEGDTVHKKRFATGYIKCANIMYLKGTLVNRLWVYSNHVMNKMVAYIISVLEKLGVKAKLRKLLKNYI